MKKSELKLPEGVTESDIQTWKQKLGKIKLISCVRENGQKVEFIIGQPTREILDCWQTHQENGKYDKAREVLKANCVLHGDKELFKEDVNLETTVLKKVTDLLELLQASEKEL